MEVITDKVLLRLGIHILVTKYLEEGALCFSKVTRDDDKTSEEAETVSNSEKKIKIK